MKKKYEKDFEITGTIAFGILNLIFIYLGLNVLLRFYVYFVSMGIIGLYYYNKDAKEEKEKKIRN